MLRSIGNALREVARILLEDQGNQEAVIDFGNRSGEQLVTRGHGFAPLRGTDLGNYEADASGENVILGKLLTLFDASRRLAAPQAVV